MPLAGAIPKLKLLIPRLATDNEGELASTVFAIQRVLKSNGTDFHDLAASIGAPASAQKPRQEQAKPKQEEQKTSHDYSGAEPQPDWVAMVDFCMERQSRLGTREREFVSNMVSNLEEWGRPTERQGKWLKDIFQRLGGEL